MNLGDNAAGIAHEASGLAIDPKEALAYRERGLAYCKTRQFQMAIDDARRAIDFQPNAAENFEILGVAYMGQLNPQSEYARGKLNVLPSTS